MKSDQRQIMKETRKQLWPENESPCIWMEAGLVDFKLCVYNLNCENCPFDAVMRNRNCDNSVNTNNQAKSYLKDSKGTKELFKPFTSVQVDKNVYYGNRYWYFEPISTTKVLIGINQVAIQLFPSLTDIIVSEEKTIQKGQTVCWLVSKHGTIRLTSPMTGQILKINNSLQDDLESKSSRVWLYMIENQNLQQELLKLKKGQQAKTFLENRQSAILEKFNNVRTFHSDIGQTLTDGGKPVESLEQLFGEKKYFKLVSEIISS